MGARLVGDLKALGGYLKKLQKLPEATRDIAVKLAPKVASLVGETMSAQTSPAGAPWLPTKSGAPAFGGASSLGYVFSRVAGKSAVRTTVLYPLHFHQDGTRRIGRKRMRAIANSVIASYVGNVLKQQGLKMAAPRQRKGESDEAYARRVERFAVAKQTRKDARTMARRHGTEAAEAARTAGGWHDPPRPLIPDEGDPIPAKWIDAIRETAREVMVPLGAEERR